MQKGNLQGGYGRERWKDGMPISTARLDFHPGRRKFLEAKGIAGEGKRLQQAWEKRLLSVMSSMSSTRFVRIDLCFGNCFLFIL